MAKGNSQKQANDSGLNFELQLWAAADKMRGHMDASEYKHVVLGLIFLKYISDAYGEKREQLLLGFADPKSDWFIKRTNLSRDGERTRPGCCFPRPRGKLRGFDFFRSVSQRQTFRTLDPRRLQRHPRAGVLPLDKVRLGGLVDIISNIGFRGRDAALRRPRAKGAESDRPLYAGEDGAARHPYQSKDVLGRVYEYFLGKFASAEGTLQSATAICSALGISLSASNGERVGVRCRNLRMNRRRTRGVRGQRWPCASTTTWKLARMNLAIRGIDANLGANSHDENFHNLQRLLLQ